MNISTSKLPQNIRTGTQVAPTQSAPTSDISSQAEPQDGLSLSSAAQDILKGLSSDAPASSPQECQKPSADYGRAAARGFLAGLVVDGCLLGTPGFLGLEIGGAVGGLIGISAMPLFLAGTCALSEYATSGK